jgi:FMN phosphatase YigB (HAD superfamily)
LKKFGAEGKEAIYIGDRIDKDIGPANLSNIYSVYIHRGGKYNSQNSPITKKGEFKPNFEILNLNEIFEIIEQINKKNISN